MSRYGINYTGSKSKIAERIVEVLPRAKHLYDVFCGGGAITHCALLSGKWEVVHFSDITNSVELLRDCLEGNIPDGSEWISREDFFARKEREPYVRLLWSFGGNGVNYLYSKEIEPYKKAVHEMIFAETPNERRLKFREVCKLIPYVLGLCENGGGISEWNTQSDARGCLPTSTYRAEITPPYVTSRVSSNYKTYNTQKTITDCKSDSYPPPIQETSRLGTHGAVAPDRLQSMERREGLPTPFLDRGGYEMQICDYRDVDILPDSVIYCDIPYKDTFCYSNNGEKINFDYGAFYDWCERQAVPVFISEYWMPEDRFKVIAEWDRTSSFSSTNNSLKVKEKLFVPNKWYEQFKQSEQLTLF